MKKLTIILLSAFLILSLSFCTNNNGDENLSSKSASSLSNGSSLTSSDSSNSGGTGGDEDYILQYRQHFYDLDERFLSLVTEEEFSDWINQFDHISKSGQRSALECTILNFIKDFGISKEDFKLKNKLSEADNGIYTDNEINVLFSGNTVLINETFVNDYALLYNGKIYSQKDLLEGDVKTFIKDGVPKDLIIEKIRSYGLEFHGRRIAKIEDEYSK